MDFSLLATISYIDCQFSLGCRQSLASSKKINKLEARAEIFRNWSKFKMRWWSKKMAKEETKQLLVCSMDSPVSHETDKYRRWKKKTTNKQWTAIKSNQTPVHRPTKSSLINLLLFMNVQNYWTTHCTLKQYARHGLSVCKLCNESQKTIFCILKSNG